MATPIPEPDHIIIWQDQYIGLANTHTQLKIGFGEQADPEKRLPSSPLEKNTEEAIQFFSNMKQSFHNIPENIKVFNDKNECLKCIGENLKKNKKIFFITSGLMGNDIYLDIIQNYSSLKTIYVFCGYYNAHLEWAEECLDQNIDCLMYNFHTDLLVRVLRDVAEYFISEGDQELNRNKQLAYSAISYFTWAKLLLERANQFDTKKIFVRLKYVEERIAYTEGLIKKLKSDEENELPSESYQ